MLYQKLSIDNFLCFDHFDIQFAPLRPIIMDTLGEIGRASCRERV